MVANDPDELVVFQNVRVLRSTAPALLCRIGDKSVWLPRGHISGKLWCTGDRGKLFVRRWVARDRHLIDPYGPAVSPVAPTLSSVAPSVSRSHLPIHLHLVQRERDAHPAR